MEITYQPFGRNLIVVNTLLGEQINEVTYVSNGTNY